MPPAQQSQHVYSRVKITGLQLHWGAAQDSALCYKDIGSKAGSTAKEANRHWGAAQDSVLCTQAAACCWWSCFCADRCFPCCHGSNPPRSPCVHATACCCVMRTQVARRAAPQRQRAATLHYAPPLQPQPAQTDAAACCCASTTPSAYATRVHTRVSIPHCPA